MFIIFVLKLYLDTGLFSSLFKIFLDTGLISPLLNTYLDTNSLGFLLIPEFGRFSSALEGFMSRNVSSG